MENVYMFLHRKTVEFDQTTGEAVHNTKLLGFLPTKEECKKQIPFYLKKPGFKNYPQDFMIEKVEADVDDYNDIPGEFTKYVYYLAHEYYDGEYDIVTDIGYYSSYQNAEKAVQRYSLEPEFKEYLEGFCISKYAIGQLFWCSGFFIT